MSESVRQNTQEISRAVEDLCSDVENYLSVDKIEEKAMPGDMLEFQRGAYTDYALYLGQGKVVTFELEDKRDNMGTFKERKLEQVCDYRKARLRNHQDVAKALFNLVPKEPKVILETAMTYINRPILYEFDFRNSEYYCTLWRYGIGFSTQVADQAWLPAKSGKGEVKPRSNLFGPYGYAKYKTLAMTERGERSPEEY